MRIGLLLSISFTLGAAALAAGPEGIVPVAPLAPPAVPAPATDVAAPAIDPVVAELDSIAIRDWVSEAATVTTNSASPILQEYRIGSTIHKRFSRPQRTVDVFVYTFPEGRCAYGAYSSLRTGSSNIVVRGDTSSEDDQNICFLSGTRFVRISSSVAEDDMSKQAASAIADQLASKIDEHSDPSIYFRGLPVLERMRGTERILMGPLAARKFIAIPFIQSLRLQDARITLGADYQFPHPEPDRAKAIVIDYGDTRTAANIYTEYSEKIGPLYKSRLLSDSIQLSKTGQSYLLCGHNGTKVFIVAGARRKLAPMILARQFAN